MHTQVIDFHPPTQGAPAIRLPVATEVFRDRGARFEHLAIDHSLHGWLRLLGHLSAVQHTLITALPALALPDDAAFERARTHHMPPLNATALHAPAVWRDVVRQLAPMLAARLDGPTPDAVRTALASLGAADDATLESLATMVLSGEPDPGRAAVLPFVGAALQVVYTRWASQLTPKQLPPLDSPGVCPCCGSLPVASVVRLDHEINNLRYLHCALCNTQWNVPRATCTACGSDASVALQEIAGSNGAVRAETCDHCHAYLKLITHEKDPLADPVADDLATLALDMLVDELGYQRAGPNLLFVPGGG